MGFGVEEVASSKLLLYGVRCHTLCHFALVIHEQWSMDGVSFGMRSESSIRATVVFYLSFLPSSFVVCCIQEVEFNDFGFGNLRKHILEHAITRLVPLW